MVLTGRRHHQQGPDTEFAVSCVSAVAFDASLGLFDSTWPRIEAWTFYIFHWLEGLTGPQLVPKHCMAWKPRVAFVLWLSQCVAWRSGGTSHLPRAMQKASRALRKHCKVFVARRPGWSSKHPKALHNAGLTTDKLRLENLLHCVYRSGSTVYNV
jgi:hypothetical protein